MIRLLGSDVALDYALGLAPMRFLAQAASEGIDARELIGRIAAGAGRWDLLIEEPINSQRTK